MGTPIRLLSFDGGSGGPTYVRLLVPIEKDNPGFLASADVYAGSSFGALAAMYLAAFLPLDPTEDQVDSVIQDCISATDAFVEALLPTLDDYARLLFGWVPMVDGTAVQSFVESTFGDLTLGDLQRKVVVHASRGESPWAPAVMCNFGPDASNDLKVSDAVLRSGAFPIWAPLRAGHADGFLYTNAPAMVAVTEIVNGWDGERNTALLDDIVAFSMGMDGDSSCLSNVIHPTGLSTLVDAVIDELSKAGDDADFLTGAGDAVRGLSDEHLDLAARALGVTGAGHRTEREGRVVLAIGDAWQRLPPDRQSDATRELLERRDLADRTREVADAIHELREHAKGELEQRFDLQLRQAPKELDVLTESDSWGWIQWLGWLLSPVWLLQAMMTNQGLGVQQQTERLLPAGNAFRLAPMMLMTTNDVFIALFFHQYWAVKLAANLVVENWSWWLTSLFFDFQPDVHATNKWIAGTWLGSTSNSKGA